MIVHLDIETLPPDVTDPLWIRSYDRAVARAESRGEDAPDVWVHRTAGALDPALGRICTICVALDDDSEPVLIDGTDEGAAFGTLDAERRMLRLLNGGLALVGGSIVWHGHNVAHFDAPFIQFRAMVHGSRGALINRFGRLDRKPWEGPFLDTKDLTPSTGRGAALDAIVGALGIAQQDGAMGGDVYAAYLRGDFGSIRHHNVEDVRQCRALSRILRNIMDAR